MYNKKLIPVANPFLDSREEKAVNYVVKKNGLRWETRLKNLKINYLSF